MATFEFDHVGITTTQKQPAEVWVELATVPCTIDMPGCGIGCASGSA